MEKTVLIEQTAKKIKLAELIVLVCLFGSIATGPRCRLFCRMGFPLRLQLEHEPSELQRIFQFQTLERPHRTAFPRDLKIEQTAVGRLL